MILCADDGGSDSVLLSVRVDRSVRRGLDDLVFRLGWSRDRVVNEILKRVLPDIEVVSVSSSDPSEGLDK